MAVLTGELMNVNAFSPSIILGAPLSLAAETVSYAFLLRRHGLALMVMDSCRSRSWRYYRLDEPRLCP
jgi:hypothetical protein